jgi:hypothetical protein
MPTVGRSQSEPSQRSASSSRRTIVTRNLAFWSWGYPHKTLLIIQLGSSGALSSLGGGHYASPMFSLVARRLFMPHHDDQRIKAARMNRFPKRGSQNFFTSRQSGRFPFRDNRWK